MPSGRRISAPSPKPSASGSAPSIAAMVVIMIGRKRSRHASKIASSAGYAVAALALQREVDHHDGVLLDDADQQHHADQGDDAELGVEASCSASSAPTPADGSVDRIVIGWT